MKGRYKILFILFGFLFISSEYFIDKLFGDGDGQVSLWNFNGLFTLILYFLIFYLIFLLSDYLIKYRHINRDFFNSPNSKILGAFRILFGLTCLIMGVQNFDFIPILYFDQENTSVYSCLNALFILNQLILIFGIGGRIPSIINFFLISLLLHNDVGRDQLKIAGFWMIFMKLDDAYVPSVLLPFQKKINNKIGIFKTPDTSYNWPIVFLLINVSVLIFSSGISKAIDPVWVQGNGFYYTFLNDWLKQYKTFDFLADSHALMLFMNYGTIILEIIILFLIIIPETRLYGIISIFLMYGLLTFVFRIDAIGPSGLLIGFIGIAGLKSAPLISENIEKQIDTVRLKWFMSLILFPFFLTFITQFLEGNLFYPRVTYPFKYIRHNKFLSDTHIAKRLNKLQQINSSWHYFSLISDWYEPFGMQHFLTRFLFRIELYDKSGILIKEEYTFNSDGTTNFFGPSGGILKPRVIQNHNSTLQHLASQLACDSNKKVSEYEIKLLKSIIKKYKIKRLSEIKAGNAKLFLQPLIMPDKYVGRIKTFSNNNWQLFLDYNLIKDELIFYNIKNSYNFQNFDNSFFKKGEIVFSPCY